MFIIKDANCGTGVKMKVNLRTKEEHCGFLFQRKPKKKKAKTKGFFKERTKKGKIVVK
jgi:hypothetical protein